MNSELDTQRGTLKWIELFWILWILVLFGSYFYHMLTLPGRWEKILALLDQLV